MKDLKIFNNEEFGQIRTIIDENNEPWFVGKDVADILEYSRPDHAISKHVDEEDKLMYQIDTSGQKRNMYVINESGLYSLIFSSKMDKAKEFKRWVTSEVLPAIRKHGAYMTDGVIERTLTDPDYLIMLATNLKEEKAKRALAEAQNERNKPKVLFADTVVASKDSVLVGGLAKILKQNGVDIGANRLFEWLRQEGFLCKSKGENWNTPTQRSMEQGLFEIKVRTINNPDGSTKITRTPKVTGKGQIYFVNKFLG